jgi:hypothetical protein
MFHQGGLWHHLAVCIPPYIFVFCAVRVVLKYCKRLVLPITSCWFYNANNIWWRVQIIELFIVKFSSFCNCSLCRRSRYFPQRSILTHCQLNTLQRMVKLTVEYYISICRESVRNNKRLSAGRLNFLHPLKLSKYRHVCILHVYMYVGLRIGCSRIKLPHLLFFYSLFIVCYYQKTTLTNKSGNTKICRLVVLVGDTQNALHLHPDTICSAEQQKCKQS